MKKKLSKVLAVVLSLVMVFGLAAVDTTAVGQAAKKKVTKLKLVKTGKRAVKSGQARTIKIKGTNAKKAKWSVTGTGKKYIKLSTSKGAKNRFTVKANATGKAKITAKLSSKNKVSVTYTLSCNTTGVDFAEKEVKVETGVETTLKLVAVPSNAVCPAATYDVVVVKDGAESKPADNTVTLAAVTGGVSFASTTEGTYKVTATAGTFTATAVVTVADRVAVLQTVKQTEINKLELTFDSDCANVKDADLVITNGSKTRVNVKKVTVDAKDNKKCVVETLVDLDDGKENTIEYKGTELKFTASNGEVADLLITPETAPINTLVPVECKALDANGVIIATVKYGDMTQSAYDFIIDIPEGGSTDDANHGIKMDTIGAKANVTVTYRSGKFDKDNNPIELPKTAVITAVAAGNISTYKEYTYVTVDLAEGQKYTDLDADKKNNGKVKVQYEAESIYTLSALVEDDLGYERVNGSLTEAGYVLSSADDTIATVNGDDIQGVKAGKTFVVVSDADGKVQFTIPVEVLAAPVLTSISTDKSSIFLSAGNTLSPEVRSNDAWKGQSNTIEVTAYDQYGDKYTDVTYSTDTANGVSTNRDKYVALTDAGEKKVAFEARKLIVGDYDADKAPGALKEGGNHTNYYDITVKDDHSDATKTKKVYVRVSQPKFSAAKTIKLEVADAKVDTTLSKDDANDVKNNIVKLAVYDASGVFVAYDYLPSTTASIQIKKAGKEVKDVIFAKVDAGNYVTAGSLVVSSAATAATAAGAKNDVITGGATTQYELMCRNFKSDGSVDNVADKIGTGSYQIRVAGVKIVSQSAATQADFSRCGLSVVSLAAASSEVITANVSVNDAQATPVIGQQHKTLDDLTLSTVLAKAFRVTVKDAAENYDPDAEKPAPYKFATVKSAYFVNENVVSFTKIAVYVPYAGDKYVKSEVSAPYAVRK